MLIRRCVCVAIGRNDNEAAAIRANAAIPLAVGVFYFEVTVLAKGIHGYFGIGICGPHVLLTRLPGKRPRVTRDAPSRSLSCVTLCVY